MGAKDWVRISRRHEREGKKDGTNGGTEVRERKRMGRKERNGK